MKLVFSIVIAVSVALGSVEARGKVVNGVWQGRLSQCPALASPQYFDCIDADGWPRERGLNVRCVQCAYDTFCKGKKLSTRNPMCGRV